MGRNSTHDYLCENVKIKMKCSNVQVDFRCNNVEESIVGNSAADS